MLRVAYGTDPVLLGTARKDASAHLDTLLKLNTRSGYGSTPSAPAARKQAGRAAAALLEVAEAVAKGLGVGIWSSIHAPPDRTSP